jgi:outer membrane murein-binding lipoprotein Lpp
VTARSVGAAALVATALAGCGSDESSLQQHLKQAAGQIRATPDARALHAKLEQTLAAVKADHPETAAEQRAKPLAIAGLRSWLRGLESQIAFVENDSGNLPVATRDAKRAYHARLIGSNRLRRAGKLLGVRIGMLSGF